MPAAISLRALAFAAAAAFTAASSACVDIVATDTSWIVEHEEKRFTVTGVPEVGVSTFDGPIEIRTWDRREVSVSVEKRATDSGAMADIVIDARQDGDQITVDVRATRREDSVFNINRRRAALVVSLPRASNLRARSNDGSISLDRINGRIELHSGDGSIRGSELAGEVTARTGDGAIRLDGVNGVLDAQTGDGSIAVNGTFDGLRARTGDGSVTIRADGPNRSREWDVATGDGAVLLEVPEGFGGELDAQTGDGRIRLDAIAVADSGESTRRREARGRIGAGGPPVRLRTGDGSITLRGR